MSIDLGADGPTPNDLGDADTGPNQLQNASVLLDAQRRDGLLGEELSALRLPLAEP